MIVVTTIDGLKIIEKYKTTGRLKLGLNTVKN